MKQMGPTGQTMMLIAVILAGCSPAPDMRDARLADFASESMDRQAEQNQVFARQSEAVLEESQQLTEVSKELVVKDAEARQELIAAHENIMSELNQQQATIDAGRQQLEEDRREIAEQRHRDPLVANVIQGLGIALLCLLPLTVAIFVVVQMLRSEPDDSAIAELLVTYIARDEPVFLPATSSLPQITAEPTFVRGRDWDVFDVAGRPQVQADDETGTMTDDEAIVEARRQGLNVDNDGYVVGGSPTP